MITLVHFHLINPIMVGGWRGRAGACMFPLPRRSRVCTQPPPPPPPPPHTSLLARGGAPLYPQPTLPVPAGGQEEDQRRAVLHRGHGLRADAGRGAALHVRGTCCAFFVAHVVVWVGGVGWGGGTSLIGLLLLHLHLGVWGCALGSPIGIGCQRAARLLPCAAHAAAAVLLVLLMQRCLLRCRYDPDEIEEEQRERERRNSTNRLFSQFVKRVQQDIWERDYG